MIGFHFTIGCPDCASELETVTEARQTPGLLGAVLRCTECSSEHHVAVTLQRVDRHVRYPRRKARAGR